MGILSQHIRTIKVGLCVLGGAEREFRLFFKTKFMLGIVFDTDELNEKLQSFSDRLSQKEIKRAMYLAINKTAKQVRTQSDRNIRRVYNIRQSFILRYIKIANANYGKMYADILLPTKPVPIGEFMQTRNSKKQGGVVVQIKKGENEVVRGAFMLNSKFTTSTRLSVMHRSFVNNGTSYAGNFQFRHKRISSGKDLPIGAMFSVSPFSSVFNPIVKQQIKNVGENNLQDNTFAMLQKMADGVIKQSNNKGRYRFR